MAGQSFGDVLGCPRRYAVIYPSLDVESEILRQCDFVIGIDEVGRGAIAGPVTVGAAVLTAEHTTWPEGLRDSKTLTQRRRESIAPQLREWATVGLGWIDADRIDDAGIAKCLADAAVLAIEDLQSQGVDLGRCHVLLDGSHDWLSDVLPTPMPITVRAKADRDCVSVAAAACYAKVARDAYMQDASLREPHYAWESNKGYGTVAHLAAIREHGASVLHRQTWLH